MQYFFKIWLLCLFFIPFFSISGIPLPFIYPKVILFQFLIGLGLIGSLFISDENNEVELGRIQVGFFSLLIFSILSLFWVSDMPLALFGSFWRGTGIIFYLAIVIGSLTLKEARITKDFLAAVFIAGGSLMSLIVLFKVFFVSPKAGETALMGNPNPLAYWVGSTIFVNLIFRHIFDGKKKYLNYFIHALCFVTLIYLGSRASLGGVILGLIAFALMADKKTFKISLGAMLAGIIALSAQYFLSQNSIVSNMIERSTKFVRLGVWQGAWDSFLAKPILGYGINGLIQGYWYNYTPTLGKDLEWNDNAHSVLFNIMGEFGLIGLIIFGAIIFFILKEIFQKEKNQRGAWLGFFIFTLSYSMVQPYYPDPSILTLYVLFLFSDKAIYKFNPNLLPFKGLKLVLALVLIFVSFKQYSQIKLINKVRIDIVNNENFRKPWDEYMSQTSYLDRAGMMRQLNKQMKATLNQNLPRFERYKTQFPRFMVSEYPKIIEAQPQRPRALENYADWLTRNKEYDKALQNLDKILEGSANIPRAYKIKAQIYEEIRQYQKAKEMLLKAKKLNPDYMTLDQDLIYIENKLKGL